jgi:hypothetical protein
MTPREYRKKYPHLAGVIDMEGAPGAGMCVHRSAAFVLDVIGAEMVIAVCSPATEEDLKNNPNSSTIPFIHAWGEWKDQVFAPTQLKPTGVRLFPKAVYYHHQRPLELHRLTRPQVLKLAKKIGLSAHLRKGVPAKESVGEAFMEAAGIRWKDVDGALLPADY